MQKIYVRHRTGFWTHSNSQTLGVSHVFACVCPQRPQCATCTNVNAMLCCNAFCVRLYLCSAQCIRALTQAHTHTHTHPIPAPYVHPCLDSWPRRLFCHRVYIVSNNQTETATNTEQNSARADNERVISHLLLMLAYYTIFIHIVLRIERCLCVRPLCMHTTPTIFSRTQLSMCLYTYTQA